MTHSRFRNLTDRVFHHFVPGIPRDLSVFGRIAPPLLFVGQSCLNMKGLSLEPALKTITQPGKVLFSFENALFLAGVLGE